MSNIPERTRDNVMRRDAAFACVFCIRGRGMGTCVDHVRSDFRNGPTVEINLVKSCGFCNLIKGVIDLDLFARQLQRDTGGRLRWRDTVARVKRQLALPIP
jgi:5-methylcytosine-specific restriction endonuclease McrA